MFDAFIFGSMILFANDCWWFCSWYFLILKPYLFMSKGIYLNWIFSYLYSRRHLIKKWISKLKKMMKTPWPIATTRLAKIQMRRTYYNHWPRPTHTPHLNSMPTGPTSHELPSLTHAWTSSVCSFALRLRSRCSTAPLPGKPSIYLIGSSRPLVSWWPVASPHY